MECPTATKFFLSSGILVWEAEGCGYRNLIDCVPLQNKAKCVKLWRVRRYANSSLTNALAHAGIE